MGQHRQKLCGRKDARSGADPPARLAGRRPATRRPSPSPPARARPRSNSTTPRPPPSRARKARSKAQRARFTVKAAATKKLTVPTPSEQEAGVAFNVTLTATDEYGNLSHELYGREDARLERTRQLAQRHGARIPDLGDDGHLHRRRGHGLRAQALRRPEHHAQGKEGSTEGTSGSFTIRAAAPEHFAWSHAEVTAGKTRSRRPAPSPA